MTTIAFYFFAVLAACGGVILGYLVYVMSWSTREMLAAQQRMHDLRMRMLRELYPPPRPQLRVIRGGKQ